MNAIAVNTSKILFMKTKMGKRVYLLKISLTIKSISGNIAGFKCIPFEN